MTTTTGSPPTGRRANRAGGPDRMPVPTRQRRPGLAALALVLILGGGALSGYLVLHSAHKRSVVFATETIKAGQQITGNDLTDGQISATLKPGTDFRPVLFRDVNSLVGQYARTDIPAGSIVSNDMYSPARPGAQCSEVALAVAAGNYPPGQLRPGDMVKVVALPKQASTTSAGSGAAAGSTTTVPPTVVARAAYVTAVKGSSGLSGNGGVVISVLAPNSASADADGSDLALASANGQQTLQVIRLPDDVAPGAFVKACNAGS